MCGIAGFIGSGNEKILRAMTDSLRFRGPDAEGFFIDGNVFLGHRRLSIVDLKTGDQPMFNDDKSIVVVFNGEIYNFKELKNKLSNHLFKTESDTEVLVHAYEEWGTDLLEEINGMFAFSIWDRREKIMFLACDRFGEKPLHWFNGGESFVFASELKALMKHPLFKKEIDYASLAEYFFFEYIPSPHTIFKNVYKLEPGHFLIFKDNKVGIKRYYGMDFGESEYEPDDEKSILKELEVKLDRVVKTRLVSDVPLGIFLSGGIDSSTIAYFAQKNSSKPIKTFSIGFKESSFDESKWARVVSKRLGTDHCERIFSIEEMQRLIPEVFSQLDEPLADASILPTYLLSKMTREKVTVALGGDAGDEFWLGYPTFFAHKIYSYLKFMPAVFLKKVASLLPVSFKNFSLDFKLKKFLDGLGVKDDILRNQIWLSSFRPEELPFLFRSEISKDIASLASRRVSSYIEKIGGGENTGKTKWQKLVYAYAKSYLAEDVLTKVDRASMMNSLEVRTPFLDHEFVSFINHLPDNLKFRGSSGKYLLKKMMAPYIGFDIASRKKKGFGIPMAEWLWGDLKEDLRVALSKEKIERQGIFNYPYIEKIMAEHFERKHNHRQKLWSLFVFQKWYDNQFCSS